MTRRLKLGDTVLVLRNQTDEEVRARVAKEGLVRGLTSLYDQVTITDAAMLEKYQREADDGRI